MDQRGPKCCQQDDRRRAKSSAHLEAQADLCAACRILMRQSAMSGSTKRDERGQLNNPQTIENLGCSVDPQGSG